MPTADEIRAVIERYVKLMSEGDHDGIAALYAENGTVEDPVGAELRRGLDTVHEFYRVSAGSARLSLTGPIRVSGSEAAFPMLASLGPEDDPSYLDIIDVMSFDADTRITSMRAFWSPDSIRK